MYQTIVYTLCCLAFATIAIFLYRSYHLEPEYSGDKGKRDTKINVDLDLVYPLDPEAQTDIDIIAIHGLGTKSPDTWDFKDVRSGKVVKNWLHDADMLPSKIGKARIFTCDWPAEMLESSKMAEMRIEQIAAELSNGLNRRSPNNDDNDKRPVLFIASCLGGLILMKALTEPKKHDPIPFATRGVIFLATPFHGTAFENIAYWAKPGMSVRAWLHGKRVTTLAEAWEPSLEITSLARNFTAFQGKHEVLHSAFYETAPTDLLKKNLPWPLNALFKREEMVSPKSLKT